MQVGERTLGWRPTVVAGGASSCRTDTDHHKWKELLEAAGLRAGRLHDARHTAGTILLILGVPDTVVDSITGWEPGQSARMRRRYQHLTDRVLKDTADKVGGLLWTRPDQQPPG